MSLVKWERMIVGFIDNAASHDSAKVLQILPSSPQSVHLYELPKAAELSIVRFALWGIARLLGLVRGVESQAQYTNINDTHST